MESTVKMSNVVLQSVLLDVQSAPDEMNAPLVR